MDTPTKEDKGELTVQKEYTTPDINGLAAPRSSWKVLRENPRALILILAVRTNAIVVGVEFSLPGNLLGVPAFVKEFGAYSAASGGYAVEARVLTIWASLFATFQILGQLTGGSLADRFGRKRTLFFLLFWVYITTGLVQSVVTIYIAEIAPREVRGMMLSLFYMNMMIGGLIAIVVPYGTQARWGGDVNDLRAFRVALYAALALPTITLILELFLLVESPYYLLMRGRKEEARKSLDYINGTAPGYDSDRALAELEYTLEKEAELATLEKDSSYLDCFKGVDRRRTFCAVFPAITQNLTGQNLTGTYMTYFFSLAGESDPLISSVISSVLSLFANFCTFFLLENKRIGRWRLLFGGVIVMTFSMLAIALIDTINHSSFNYASGVMLFFFVALFGAASAMGPGAAGWVYTGESGSSRLRSKCTTLGTVGNAIVGLVMTSVIPYLLDADEANWGAKTGYLFFGLGLGCCVVIYFFIPEYSGRSFAQLDELFERRIPARKFASTVCTGEYGRDLEE